MDHKSEKYKWEIVIINDGSKDQTGKIADNFEIQYPNIRVIHHPTNLNLGNALKTGFKNAKGEIIVVMDIDLSYSNDHIEKMVDKLIETTSDIVIASPYMKGGKVTDVPFTRKIFLYKVRATGQVCAPFVGCQHSKTRCQLTPGLTCFNSKCFPLFLLV